MDTEELDPVTKTAIETANQLRSGTNGQEMLRFRHLFKPDDGQGTMHKRATACGCFENFIVIEHREDEAGNPMTSKDVAVALMGNEDAVLLPRGTRPHDLAYMIAEKRPITPADITFNAEEIRLLGYFTRDLRELRGSTFYKEGPGTISGYSTVVTPNSLAIQTSVSDEEIRSFVTIFRRLYMQTEPANFEQAVTLFGHVFGDHPHAVWVKAGVDEVEKMLAAPPDFVPFELPSPLTFSVKRLIDVFLYTQYAHQPNARRERQFEECISQVGGSRTFLTYLFFHELWSVAIEMINVGQHVAQLYEFYCRHHSIDPKIVLSPGSAHDGIGALEKAAEKTERIVNEQAQALAHRLWVQAGRPERGAHAFLDEAARRLKEAMGGQ